MIKPICVFSGFIVPSLNIESLKKSKNSYMNSIILSVSDAVMV